MTAIPIIIGEHDTDTIRQLERCLAAGGARAVLCADGHLGYAQPVGGVVAYENAISISGVGFDIGCGNLAVRTDIRAADMKPRDWARIADDIARTISFGVGRTNAERADHALFEDDEAWSIPFVASLKSMAQDQLGTVGSGNHYVDVFTSEEGEVWIGVHFGSRGLGHRIATHYLDAAGGSDGMHVDPAVVSLGTPLADDYVAAMTLAGRYAHAGREWVVQRVVGLLGAGVLESVHNHHNFAWPEEHGGRRLWVVRKGATPAFPGQRSFVGGSMGDISVILRGVDSDTSRELLYSTVHGAGRVMSRRAAAGKTRWQRDPKSGRKVQVQVSPGRVDEREMRRSIASKGIELRGGGPDESPKVYRRLRRVLDAHEGTIEIERVLHPKVVCMAGASEWDPYKD